MLFNPEDKYFFTIRDLSKSVPLDETEVWEHFEDDRLKAYKADEDENYVGYTTKLYVEREELRRWFIEEVMEYDLKVFDFANAFVQNSTKLAAKAVAGFFKLTGHTKQVTENLELFLKDALIEDINEL